MRKPLLLAGPTASGKSALALAVAERDGGMIINADALQVFEVWAILSARPTAADLARAPHRLYGHLPADHVYSTGKWLTECRAALQEADAASLRPIIVGGTGLNFSALTSGLVDIPPTPPDIRAEADAAGPNRLRAALIQKDPITAARIDLSNPARVQRAWEVWATTGQSLAKLQDATPPPTLAPDELNAVVLMPDPAWLNARIARRFDGMVEGGAVEEVLDWTAAEWPNTLPAAKAIGRREILAWQNGELSRDETITQAIIATRQYAKRQRTWIRNRFASWQHLDPAHPIKDLLNAIAPA